MALPFLILYLTQQQAFSLSLAGLALSCFGFGAFVISPISGWCCDRFNPAMILVISLLSSGLCVMLYPFTSAKLSIFLISAAWGICSEMFKPASLALTSYLAPDGQLKVCFAINRLAINLGMSIGPVVGGILAAKSFHLLFLLNGATSILAGIALLSCLLLPKYKRLFATVHSPVLRTERKQDAPAGNTSDNRRKILLFTLVLIPIVMLFFQCDSTQPYFCMHTLAIAPSTYGFLFLVNTSLIVFLEVPLNMLTAHWRYKIIIPVGMLLIALGFGILFFADSIIGVVVSVVIWTFGEMILFPSATSYIAELATHKKGTSMGIFNAGNNIAILLAPIVGMGTLNLVGAPVFWLIAGAWGVLSAGVYMLFARGEH